MDPVYTQFVLSHPDVVGIEYHTSWPSPADPFHAHNTSDNIIRTYFYGISATPSLRVDGVLEPSWVYSNSSINSVYQTRKNTPTSVSLSYTGSYDEASGAVNITVSASTDQSMPFGSYRMQIVLTESELYWNAPNGLDYFHFIMRDMYPNAGGSVIVFSGALPQTAEVTGSFNVTPYNDNNCEIVFFVQDASSKQVYQAGSVPVTQLPPPTAAPVAAFASLGQNYPNPFNPRTVIPVSMASGNAAQLAVVDVQGRMIRTLHDGFLGEGTHEFAWDGRDSNGQALASGVYLARLQSGEREEFNRLILLK